MYRVGVVLVGDGIDDDEDDEETGECGEEDKMPRKQNRVKYYVRKKIKPQSFWVQIQNPVSNETLGEGTVSSSDRKNPTFVLAEVGF